MAEDLHPSINACIENDALAGATWLPLLSGPSSSVAAASPPGFISSSPFLLPLLLAGGPPPRPRDPPSVRIGKKRKPRACKRSPTTYIAADKANFRQMVQQVTGADAPGGAEGTRAQDLPLPAVQGSGFLPTLDVPPGLLNRLVQDTATGPADTLWVLADSDPVVALLSGPPTIDPRVVI